MADQNKRQELKRQMEEFKKRACSCGSRTFVNGKCARCPSPEEPAAPAKDNGLGWVSKDFAGL